MNLESLFKDIPVLTRIHWNPHKHVSRITSDSRTIERGDLFVACPGARMNGHDFLNQAIYAGASVLVFEEIPDMIIPKDVTAVQVPNSQACLSILLKRYCGNPDKAVKLVGTTGTNGKTTITYLLHQLIGARAPSAYLGTLWYELPGQKLPALNTTPGPEVLIPLLKEMKDRHVRYSFMEVSSHAVSQRRISGLEFELAIFTQLTQDHLDYHRNMESYFQAKRAFFSAAPAPKHRLINADCPYGRRLLEEFPDARSYSLHSPADYQAKHIETSMRGARFTLAWKGQEAGVSIQLPLQHNVANVLTVLAAADILGIDPRELIPALAEIPGIPGRLERVSQGQDFDVFVDYAHTPDAFENVLREARKLAQRRILTVFGCGGDRDKEKRPMMGRIACRYSDVVMLTSDNPRSEDPEAILSDIRKGLYSAGDKPCEIHEDPDREAAIRRAVGMAEAGDVILILGKGHEDYQILGDRKIPFDDRIVAQAAFKRKGRVLSS